MLKIFKNILPYWNYVLAIIVFLFVQAFCDLALPGYTADIIDVGISRQGEEHILATKVTEEDYAISQLFMTSEEKAYFADCYSQDGSIYSLNKEVDLEEADSKILIPLVMAYQAESATDNVNLSEEEIAEYQQMYAALASGMMDDDMILQMREQVKEQIDTIGESTLKTMGIAYALKCNENAGIDQNAKQISYMWKAGIRMLLVSLLMGASSILVGFLASRVGAGVGRDLREKTFCNVVAFSNAELDKFSTASLITRSTNDIQQIQMVTAIFLRMVLYAPIIGVGGIIRVANTGANMGWIIVLAILVLLGFVAVLMGLAMPKFKIMQKLVDHLNLVSREILTGLNVIRAFGREQREEERFDEANTNLTKTQLFTNRVMTFMMPGMSMVMYCVTLLIVWVGAKKIDAGLMQVGAMTAFITYTMQIVMSFLMLTAMSIMLPRAGVAAERIDEVIQTKSSIVEKDETKSPVENKGVVSFSHVDFRYPGASEPVLTDIDFVAEPGKTTAIIGSTGCGKSSLVNLIPRFYDVEKGSITIDGVDVRDMKLSELRSGIGFVPQKGVLFSGDISSNLRFGKEDATEEELKEAASIAQAMEFISEKEDGFKSHIAQGGSNVSGGQKQRLAIARAIVKKPKIFVFDDSFSALDMKTDAILRRELSQKTKDATVIIVAQRISTILHADQILVLEDGAIVGRGTHEELLRSCEVYEQIAKSQLSEKELKQSGKEEK